MATTQSDIREWFKQAAKDSTHLIVVADTYDYTEYPVYVEQGQSARKVASEYNGKSMQRVMEVYNLKMDMEAQLNELRAFNY